MELFFSVGGSILDQACIEELFPFWSLSHGLALVWFGLVLVLLELAYFVWLQHFHFGKFIFRFITEHLKFSCFPNEIRKQKLLKEN